MEASIPMRDSELYSEVSDEDVDSEEEGEEWEWGVRGGEKKYADFLQDTLQRLRANDAALTALDLTVGNTVAGCQVPGALVGNTVLEVLRLDGSGRKRFFMGNQGATRLGEALAGPSCALRALDIPCNMIRDAGATSLGEGLARNSTLTNLNLSCNEIGGGGGVKLAKSLARNSTLTKLDLGFNKMGDKGAVRLAEGLASNRALKTLNLARNRLGTAAVDKLAEMLAVNTTLTDLDVSFLRWDCDEPDEDDNGKNAAKLVEGGTSLTSLHMIASHVGHGAVVELAAALTGNVSMTRLDLNDNGFDDDGAALLGEVLARNSTLLSLHLDGNRDIFFDGAAKLAEGLAGNCVLQRLDLDFNIGAEGALAIGRALRARPMRERADGSSSAFELRGVELAEVAAELGLPDRDAGEWTNKSMLAFFWEQHERRLAVCMLAHGRLGQGSRWGGLEVEILRIVLGYPIHYGFV